MPTSQRSTRSATKPPRLPLSRDRILDAAIAVADRDGLAAVSMRRLGQELGVEAMSLYKHVGGKDDVLGGIADRVAAEFQVPSLHRPWRMEIRESALAANDVLGRHPWAGPLLESLAEPGPARLAYLDAVIGVLRAAGFSTRDVAHAFGALDSQLYGFTLQVANWPFDVEDSPRVAAELAAQLPADRYPNLVDMAAMIADSDTGMPLDFTFGLDLILDGLERRLDAQRTDGVTSSDG